MSAQIFPQAADGTGRLTVLRLPASAAVSREPRVLNVMHCGIRILMLLCMLAAVTHAAIVQAALVEEIVQLPVVVQDRQGQSHAHSITVTIFRDDARGASPFMLLNHGRAGTAQGRARLGRARYSAISAYFVGRGFAVFVPTRVGYGVSGGPDVEHTGACDAREFAPGFEAAAAQSLAVIRYAKAQSYVDVTRGVVVGQSFGGATAVALAAKNIDGVAAAINFAGGSGGSPTSRPEHPCSPQALAQTYAEYGRTARTPMLWLYSENDRYWGREYPYQWFEGFRTAGGIAQFVRLPPYRADGHASFTGNPEAWKPHVERFLASRGF